MRIQNISNAQAVAFKSVLRTDSNETTQKLYSVLKRQENKKIILLKDNYLNRDDGNGPHLILIDDEKGKDATSFLNFGNDCDNAKLDVYAKTDAELEKMVPKEEVEQFKKELSNPRILSRSRGNTLTAKLLGTIIPTLESSFDVKKEVLYKDFLAKSKVISISDLIDVIVGLAGKSKI